MFALSVSHAFSNISCLHLQVGPHNYSTLRGILSKTTKLRTLEVELTASGRCGALQYVAAEDAVSTADILRELFYMVVKVRQSGLRLRTLNLKGCDFGSCGDFLTDAVEFGNLQILVLQQCCNISAIFRACYGEKLPTSLRHLLITSTRQIETNPLAQDSAVDDFVRASIELQSLVIDAQYDQILEPKIQSFATSSLEILMLRCDSPILPRSGLAYRYWTVERLQSFVKACPNLSELAINFPPVAVISHLGQASLVGETDEYNAFIVSHMFFQACYCVLTVRFPVYISYHDFSQGLTRFFFSESGFKPRNRS